MCGTSTSGRRDRRLMPHPSVLTFSTRNHRLAPALPHTCKSARRGTYEQLFTRRKPAPAFRNRVLSRGHSSVTECCLGPRGPGLNSECYNQYNNKMRNNDRAFLKGARRKPGSDWAVTCSTSSRDLTFLKLPLLWRGNKFTAFWGSFQCPLKLLYSIQCV